MSILGKNDNLLMYIGIGAVAAFGISWFMGKESKSNYGSTMNSLYPIMNQPTDTYVHSTPARVPRGFPDYSNRGNTLPTPFVELHMPRDAFGPGAKLANIREQGIYIPTFDGSPWILHPQI